MRTEEFKEYYKSNNIQVNPKYGFMHISLNNSYYFPGQIVRGRVYVQLIRTIRTTQAILKINGEENTGIPIRKHLKVEPASAIKRQTFLDGNNPNDKERKRSVILEIPVINILKANSENASEKGSLASGRNFKRRWATTFPNRMLK